MQLHCHTWTGISPSGPTVYLLHGLAGNGAVWAPVAAGLQEWAHAVAPDQRGHGLSALPSDDQDCAPERMGQDLWETGKALGWNAGFWIGHSMGVRTALALYELAPTWVRGLVLVDLYLDDRPPPAGIVELLRALPDVFPSRSQLRRELTQRGCDPVMVQYVMAVSRFDRTTSLWSLPFDRHAGEQVLLQAREVRTWLLAAGEARCPVLLLRGGNSTVWSALDFACEQERFARYPTLQFETVAGADHGLPFQRRLWFCERVRRFFGESAGA